MASYHPCILGLSYTSRLSDPITESNVDAVHLQVILFQYHFFSHLYFRYDWGCPSRCRLFSLTPQVLSPFLTLLPPGSNLTHLHVLLHASGRFEAFSCQEKCAPCTIWNLGGGLDIPRGRVFLWTLGKSSRDICCCLGKIKNKGSWLLYLSSPIIVIFKYIHHHYCECFL